MLPLLERVLISDRTVLLLKLVLHDYYFSLEVGCMWDLIAFDRCLFMLHLICKENIYQRKKERKKEREKENITSHTVA